MDKLWAQFQKPGAEWRGKPFWAWNGKLDKNELLRQVHVMKTMGFGGFFMHSRTGLVTEYLGREWFDLINACADEAKKLGMEAWLYDEDRWPSGLAGGLVTQHPQYRARSVVLEIMPAVAWSTLTWNKELLAVFLARVDGMSYSDCQRLTRRTPPAAGETRNLLVFRNMETKPSSFYNGYTYVDTLNPDATETFIRLTHEKYKRKCGSRIGRSIKGIFTDEPHRGRLMIKDDSDPQSAWSAPWTKKLPERFRSDFGYDLVDNLPDVFLRKDGAPVSQVKWHFVECLNRMFLDHFAKPYAEWCRKNKLLVTGHVLHEDNLGAQTAMNGSLMRYYEHMDYPGVDLLTRQNRCYWVAKQLASAARQLGRRWMLSEMYGCTGWDMPFSDHKALGDWQALFGINVRCPHLSWYTMEGEAKRDYPASMIHHSTWWDRYDTVERYFARIGILMAQGKPECDILVLNPVESIWCQVYPGWAIWLESDAPEMLPLEQAYRDLFHWLSGAQLDFDYGDEEMLSRMASLRRENGAPRLRVGHAEYRMIIVPKMVTIRETTLKLLQRFRDAGGEVLFTAEPPTHVDALPSSAPSEFAARCTRLPSPTGVSLDAAVAKILGTPAVRVLSSDGTPDARIMAQMRKGRGYSVVMLLNTDKEQAAENLRVRLRATGVIQEWNCLDGSRRIVPARRRGDTLEFTESFPAGGERLYVVTNEKESALPVRKPARSLGRLDWCGPIAYRLDEPNVCVLDWAQFRIGRGPWSEEMEILKADQAVRRKLDIALRGGEMLQPWWVNRQNKGRKDSKGRVSFRYSFNITEKIASGVDLALENPANWMIRVNGIELDPGSTTGWWVDVSLQKVPIPPGALKTGKNLVEIETDFHYGSNPEAMFILGNFGVTLKGRTRMIGKLPATLNLGDITLQGLPFYSGKVAYSLPIPSPAPASRCQAIIRLPSIGGACAVVRVPDQEGIVIPWHPYEADITHLLQPGVKMLELEVVTTRRNSFGPLHEWPHSTTAVGPWSFLTEGERFREDYVLVPNGLLKPPELHWKTAR